MAHFSRRNGVIVGYRSRCKVCVNGQYTYLALRYGMGLPDFEALLSDQNGACGICGKPLREPKVDHDHATGRVRGILCHRCNIWLAAVEDPHFTIQAAIYIAHHARNPSHFSAQPKIA